jgi:hypothetical protein
MKEIFVPAHLNRKQEENIFMSQDHRILRNTSPAPSYRPPPRYDPRIDQPCVTFDACLAGVQYLCAHTTSYPFHISPQYLALHTCPPNLTSPHPTVQPSSFAHIPYLSIHVFPLRPAHHIHQSRYIFFVIVPNTPKQPIGTGPGPITDRRFFVNT